MKTVVEGGAVVVVRLLDVREYPMMTQAVVITFPKSVKGKQNVAKKKTKEFHFLST